MIFALLDKIIIHKLKENKMKSLSKIEFTTNVNVDDGYKNYSQGMRKQSMELFLQDERTDSDGNTYTNLMIEWDILSLETTEHIGLVIINNTLEDYDGVFELPKEAIALLRHNNYIVPKNFEEDESETEEKPAEEHQEVGTCPKCGDQKLNYTHYENDQDGNLVYPYTCSGCGFDGQELYSVSFIKHLDEDGEEIKK